MQCPVTGVVDDGGTTHSLAPSRILYPFVVSSSPSSIADIAFKQSSYSVHNHYFGVQRNLYIYLKQTSNKMSKEDVIVVDEDGEIMDETQVKEYKELVEDLGTRAVSLGAAMRAKTMREKKSYATSSPMMKCELQAN
jgi:nucleoside-triphosphatase THEP1